MNVTFSIVIPTYNNLNQLQGAIESALAQTIPCEAIVVDDGSDDGTEAFGRRLRQSALYYRHRVRLGYGESLNAGVELAQGNWIKFLNDSARLDPTCLEQMKQAIEEFPQAALVSCQTLEIDPDSLDGTPPSSPKPVVCISQEEVRDRILADGFSFGSPTQVAVRRDAFLRAGGWSSPSCSSYAAIESWMRMVQYGDVLSIEKPLSYDRPQPALETDEGIDGEQLQAQLALERHLYDRLPETYRSQLAENPELQQLLKLHRSLVGLQSQVSLKSNAVSHPSYRSRVRTWSRWAQILTDKIKRSARHQTSARRRKPNSKASPIFEPMTPSKSHQP